jgi:hypothetical protein
MLSLQDWDKLHLHKWTKQVFEEGVRLEQVKSEKIANKTEKKNGLRPLFMHSEIGAAKVFADSLRAHSAPASYVKIP